MGYFIRFILALIVINFIIKLIFRFFMRWRGRKTNYNAYNPHQHRQKSTQETPISQEERILDFQKRSFSAEDAEDAEFIEIKDN